MSIDKILDMDNIDNIHGGRVAEDAVRCAVIEAKRLEIFLKADLSFFMLSTPSNDFESDSSIERSL